MTIWDGLNVTSFLIGVWGLWLAIRGCGPEYPKPVPPDLPPWRPGDDLITGHEAEVAWSVYMAELDRWERSNKEGPRPRMAFVLLGLSLLGFAVSAVAQLLGA